MRWSWFPFPELTSSSLTSAVTRPLCCTPLHKQTQAIDQHWRQDTKCFCVVTLGLENGLQRCAATPPLSVQTAPCGAVGVQMESKLLPRSDINSLTNTFDGAQSCCDRERPDWWALSKREVCAGTLATPSSSLVTTLYSSSSSCSSSSSFSLSLWKYFVSRSTTFWTFF